MATAVEWPAVLPCPLIAGTAADIDPGTVQTAAGSPVHQFRRVHRQMPHTFALSWLFKQEYDYAYAVSWLNAHGFGWFSIPLPSAYAGEFGQQTVPHIVRLTGDLRTELVRSKTDFRWRLSGQVEWMPTRQRFLL